MIRNTRHIVVILLLVLTAITLLSCSAKKEKTNAGDTIADSVRIHGYAALDDSATMAKSDTTPATTQLAEVIEKLPGQGMIANSIKIIDTAFLGITGINDAVTAQYVIGGDTATLFASEDRAGKKYLALVEFATTQSQVRPFMAPFDHGYSVDFMHLKRGRVIGGLKAGFLVGVVDYKDSMEPFVRNWIKAID